MKLDRLLGILAVLMQKERVTAPFLAEKFEVTRCTIGRDVDALSRAGIPIVTQQGSGGGISVAPGYKLDKAILTADELSSILAALKGIGSVSEQTGLERTLDKLHIADGAVMSLAEPIIIDLAAHHKGSLTVKIELIKKALREQRIIAFDYYYEKGDSHRRIEPAFLLFQWGHGMFSATALTERIFGYSSWIGFGTPSFAKNHFGLAKFRPPKRILTHICPTIKS